MPRFRRDFLIERAKGRCEYCHFERQSLALGLYLDHIIARQHGGEDNEDNLAMACEHCSACKGPNISSVDPLAGERVWLFHPRRDVRREHFMVVGDEIHGRTATGRATAALLDMNNPRNKVLRRLLRLSGSHVES